MIYTVKEGDSLDSIALQQLGNKAWAPLIAKENNIEDIDQIYPGQHLNLAIDIPVDSEQKERSSISLSSLELQTIFPIARQQDINLYLSAINRCFVQFSLTTPLRVAHFIAQIGHESAQLKCIEENLNYTPKALKSVFSQFFQTDELAIDYARQPERIANLVYANRMGNGNESSGDGWLFRGRGLIQLTGKDSYKRFASDIGYDAFNQPDLITQNAELTAAAAGWYWHAMQLNINADQDDIKLITRRISGSYNGLAERTTLLNRAKKVLDIL